MNVRFTPKSRHWNSVVECPLVTRVHGFGQEPETLAEHLEDGVFKLPVTMMVLDLERCPMEWRRTPRMEAPSPVQGNG